MQRVRAAGCAHGTARCRAGHEVLYWRPVPGEVQERALIARHGSWNRSNKVGGDVVLVNIKKDGTAEAIEPFVTGFLENNTYVGRPVDVMVMKDGSILISDDWNGAVWKVSYGAARTAGR